jgi:hypothetical protein
MDVRCPESCAVVALNPGTHQKSQLVRERVTIVKRDHDSRKFQQQPRNAIDQRQVPKSTIASYLGAH